MSIDDVSNPFHAAELERGEDPRRNTAQFKLASLLADVDDIHTVHHQMLVAGRVLAFLPRIVGWVDAEQQPGKRSVQLRQQPAARADDETFFAEQAHYHLSGYRDAMAALAAMGSVYARDYDPDARDQDREDARDRVCRQDERAVVDAPRVVAS